jgi:hypothetical protein
MKRFSFLLLIAFVLVAFSQTVKTGGGTIMAAPAPEDSADRKIYVPSVPACTVVFYPVIREDMRIGKNDRVRLILRSKPKDSSTYKELWQWDYQLKNSDSANVLYKVNIVP